MTTDMRRALSATLGGLLTGGEPQQPLTHGQRGQHHHGSAKRPPETKAHKKAARLRRKAARRRNGLRG